MDDNLETPLDPFDLPDWGSDHAPPLEPEPRGDSVLPPGAPASPPVLSTLPPPGGLAVIGLVTAVGSAEADAHRMDEAIASARDAALDRLVEAGRGVGATLVAGVSFSLAVRKEQVTILVAGTALHPRT